MKYFVIHSGSDFDTVKELMAKWSEMFDNVQFVVLEGSQENWEGDATARIRQCGKVLYLVGQKSADSPYIQLELDIANRESKDVYVYKLAESNRINDCLLKNGKKTLVSNGEYEGEIVIGKARERVFLLNEDQLLKKMYADSQDIEKFLKGGNFEDKETLIQQYQIFVQTSEELVKRKQSVNNFYVTLNSLMLSTIVTVACAAEDLLKLASGSPLAYIVCAFLSLMGIVICGSWITLLNSYSDLNASKMDIIGCIEERLALKLYDTEWALLTRRMGKRKYRSFTVKELAVAKVFLGLYSLVAVVCIIVCFL